MPSQPYPDAGRTVRGGDSGRRHHARLLTLAACVAIVLAGCTSTASGGHDPAGSAAASGSSATSLVGSSGRSADHPSASAASTSASQPSRTTKGTFATVSTGPGPTITAPANTSTAPTSTRSGSGRSAASSTQNSADPASRTSGHVTPTAPSRTSAGTSTSPKTSKAHAVPELPGGGRVMFPDRRLVALYGNPYDSKLGALGQQGLPAAIHRAKKVAAQYDKLSSVPVVPAFEIIATVATAAAGPDGDYSAESSVADLSEWVREAGKAGMYVILDLQPGRADLLDQAKRYRSLLELPYVGLALDPEWKLGPGERPLQQIGSVDASEVNRVIRWLSRVTATNHLPQKVLVLHQFRLAMLRHEADIVTSDPHVAVLIHMDGQGAPRLKDATWRAVVAAAPRGTFFGWKNFYTKDTPMLSPKQTIAHEPRPLMISYQ